MATSMTYQLLNRAQVSYEYLHTNSTTHDFLFGAMVELVDNSRDADAHNMRIYHEDVDDDRAKRMLCFLDDGCGMNPEDAYKIMTLGFSAKRFNEAQIGQYGNGLKSGAMRIGHDFILFTKADQMLTCVFLSRTFHDKENIHEVVVPMPTFTIDGQPKVDGEDEKRKHEIEMNIIYKYSPFKDKDSFFAQFRKLDRDNGTMVCIFNMRMLDSGEPELDFETKPDDILINDSDGIKDIHAVPERESLRAYLSIVYKDPSMKIYINGQKVRTRRIVNCLYKARSYDHMSKNFKERADKDIKRAQEAVDSAKRHLADAKDKLGRFKASERAQKPTVPVRSEERQLNYMVTHRTNQLTQAEKMLKDKQKHRNDPKPLKFVFGLNLERRTHCGAMIYNNGRLIKMYQKVGPQKDSSATIGGKCQGVIAVVDVPYVVLEPTHNKQDFANAREYHSLLNDLGKYMEYYWEDIRLREYHGGLPKFWEEYGYKSTNPNEPPSDEPQYLAKRKLSSPPCIQCDKCLRWRIVQPKRKEIEKEPPLTWTCPENPDAEFNSCDKTERLPLIDKGKVIKAPETAEQRQAKEIRLKKDLEKKKKELEQIEREAAVEKQRKPLPQNASFRRQQQQATTRYRKASTSDESEEESEEEEDRPARSSRAARPPSKSSPAKPAAKAKTKAQLREQKLKEQEAERKRKAAEERRRKEREASANRRSSKASTSTTSSARKRVVVEEDEEGSESSEVEVQDILQSRRASGRIVTVGSSPPESSKATTANGPTPAKRSTRNSDVNIIEKETEKSARASTSSSTPKPTRSQAAAEVSSTTDLATPSTSSSGGAGSAAAAGGAAPAIGTKQKQLGDLVRRLLRQFCPPRTTKYPYDKNDFEKLDEDQLLDFNFDEFANAWHMGISDLIEAKKSDALTETNQKLETLMAKCCQLLAPLYQNNVPDDATKDADKCVELLNRAIPAVKEALAP